MWFKNSCPCIDPVPIKREIELFMEYTVNASGTTSQSQAVISPAPGVLAIQSAAFSSISKYISTSNLTVESWSLMMPPVSLAVPESPKRVNVKGLAGSSKKKSVAHADWALKP